MTPTTPPAVSEAMREAVARILDPVASAYGDAEYYGPETSKANASARLRVALKNADRIISGPIASEIARLTGERDAALAEAKNTLSMMAAWFDMKADIGGDLAAAFKGSLQGYLRTCRCGGMPDDEASMAEAVLSGFVDNQAALLVTPIIQRRIAAAEAETARLRAALGKLLPGKLCGESWDLPDTDTVQIVVRFGDLREARAALSSQEKTDG